MVIMISCKKLYVLMMLQMLLLKKKDYRIYFCYISEDEAKNLKQIIFLNKLKQIL